MAFQGLGHIFHYMHHILLEVNNLDFHLNKSC